jgi:TonB family protein
VTDAHAAIADLVRALPFGAQPFALLMSVSAHVALALAFTHAAPRIASRVVQSGDVLVELSALDLTADDPSALIAHSPSTILAPHHSHPYPVPPDRDFTAHDPPLRHEQPSQRGGDAGAAAKAVIDAPAPTTPRFVMTMASRARAPSASAALDGPAGTPSVGVADEPVPEAALDTAATLLSGHSASYTREAEAAGVEATVPLEIVVDSAGSVSAARVLLHVGYGLDEAALQGIRAYRFSPARRAGKALAVRMRWMMRFQLR